MRRLLPLACTAVLAFSALVAPAMAAPRVAAGAAAGAVVSAHPVISIANFGFHGDLTVRPGATVTVKNKDSVTHTLTAKPPRLFNTGPIRPGHKATFVAPTRAGRYPFRCRIHPEMTATLIVRPRH